MSKRFVSIDGPKVSPRPFRYLTRVSFFNLVEDFPVERVLNDEGIQATLRPLQVYCSKCQTSPLHWCRTNKGNLYQGLHKARWEAAIKAGWFEKSTLDVPEREE